jgi:aromatic ring-opening dioxygenase catalytic subunit (LigB family)
MPAIFFGHGNPMNALQQNDWTKAWVRSAQHCRSHAQSFAFRLTGIWPQRS